MLRKAVCWGNISRTQKPERPQPELQTPTRATNGDSHLPVGVAAEVPAAQAAQEPSRRRRQEGAQPLRKPGVDEAAVHQLLVGQQGHSDLPDHVQDLRRRRPRGGVWLRARGLGSFTLALHHSDF